MRYTEKILREAVSKSTSVTEIIRQFNLHVAGGTHSHISKMIKRYGIDTSHFLGRASNCGSTHKGGLKKRTALEILVDGYSDRERYCNLKRALIESGITYTCDKCKIGDSYNNEPITLHVDHINGDWSNNKIENLRFLCPNCHSQTSNYGSKNKLCGRGVKVAAADLESADVNHGSSTLLAHTCIDCSKKISKTAIRCKSCAASKLHEKTCKRPSYEQLQLDLFENDNNLCAIGRKYSVSDNAVRKWIRFYKG